MSSFADRPYTALIVIDLQVGVVEAVYERDRVVRTINDLVDRARDAGVTVIWVQHSDDDLLRDSDAWQLIPEIRPRQGEAVVHKIFGDSFEDTNLDEVLAEHRVGHLVVTGAQTEACVRSTLHGAVVRGYDVTLVADAHTTEDLREWGFPIAPEQSIAYTNHYWSWTRAPDRTGAVVPAAEITFS